MLFGRERECAIVDALLADAGAGRSAALVVRGEAGVGKSALLTYAAERAAAARVLRCTGVESESELAFAGLHALLHPLLDALAQLPPPQAAALGAALGQGDGAGGDRFLVSLGVLG